MHMTYSNMTIISIVHDGRLTLDQRSTANSYHEENSATKQTKEYTNTQPIAVRHLCIDIESQLTSQKLRLHVAKSRFFQNMSWIDYDESFMFETGVAWKTVYPMNWLTCKWNEHVYMSTVLYKCEHKHDICKM